MMRGRRVRIPRHRDHSFRRIVIAGSEPDRSSVARRPGRVPSGEGPYRQFSPRAGQSGYFLTNRTASAEMVPPFASDTWTQPASPAHTWVDAGRRRSRCPRPGRSRAHGARRAPST
jgi:hypothetical protein